MSDTSKIIIGLADAQVGQKVGNIVANVTASGSAVTVGSAAGSLGFFGASPVAKQGVTLSNVTSVAQALINLGLASQNS